MKEEVNYLNELNEAQLKPVLHKDGPLIVIAGAGSGKTRVLTYRITYLMHTRSRFLFNFGTHIYK